jgi:hypothetical protein
MPPPTSGQVAAAWGNETVEIGGPKDTETDVADVPRGVHGVQRRADRRSSRNPLRQAECKLTPVERVARAEEFFSHMPVALKHNTALPRPLKASPEVPKPESLVAGYSRELDQANATAESVFRNQVFVLQPQRLVHPAGHVRQQPRYLRVLHRNKTS